MDGLDEVVTRRHDELAGLVNALQSVAREGVRVFVNCRQNLWAQRIQPSLPDFRVFHLLPLDEADAERILGGRKLPGCVTGIDGRPYRWALTPLILYFLLTLIENDQDLESIASRSDLYQRWTTWLAQKALANSSRNQAILKFFGKFAMTLLEMRQVAMDMAAFHQVRPMVPELDVDDVALLDLEVLTTTDAGDIKFCHESVHEFFVAWSLWHDFKAIVREGLETNAVMRMGIDRVKTDFIQASMYGFLEQLLGQTFVHEVATLILDRHRFRRLTPYAQRNLIEYVGMTYRDSPVLAVAVQAGSAPSESESELVNAVLKILESDDFEVLVRFNAARVLERIHPGAPRPYFDYVSDWGEGYWRREGSVGSRDAPWVVRGALRSKEDLGKQFAFMPNERDVGDNAFWEMVSARIIRVLTQIVDSDSDDALILRVNCSNALIRWFHPSHSTELMELIRRIEGTGDFRTRWNLLRCQRSFKWQRAYHA